MNEDPKDDFHMTRTHSQSADLHMSQLFSASISRP